MIIKKRKYLFFTSARIILDDKELIKAFREKKYHYLTGLSYQKFDFGSDVKIKQKKTILIDLTRSLNDLFAAFRKDTRNGIRHTFNNLEHQFITDDKNRKGVLALYRRFEKMQGRKPRTDIFEASRAFGAYYNNKLISAIICYDIFPVLRSRANVSTRLEATTNEERRVISRATRRIIYEILRYGKERGYTHFDQGAINTNDPAKASITAFKRGFGGKEVDEYTYTYRQLF